MAERPPAMAEQGDSTRHHLLSACSTFLCTLFLVGACFRPLFHYQSYSSFSLHLSRSVRPFFPRSVDTVNSNARSQQQKRVIFVRRPRTKPRLIVLFFFLLRPPRLRFLTTTTHPSFYVTHLPFFQSSVNERNSFFVWIKDF